MAARMRFHHFKIFTKNGWKFTQKMVHNLQFQLFAFKKLNDYNHWVLRNGTAMFVVTEHSQAGDGLPSVVNSDHSHRRGEVSPVGIDLVSRTDGPRITSQIEQLIKHNVDCHGFINATTFNKFSSNPNINDSCNSISKKYDNLNSNCNKQNHQHENTRSDGPSTTNLRVGNTNETSDATEINIQNYCEERQHIDSVYDVAFHVQNVEQTFENAVQGGAEPVCEPRTIEDARGEISMASVRSCVGDVVHTLLNTNKYNGIFLPGFTEYRHEENDEVTRMDQNVRVHFDHVTYVCPIGDSERVLNWYENCFGMRRLKINSDEDDEEGFVVRGNDVGMRLKAMEYWRCNESRFVVSNQDADLPTNFVIAEALPGQGKNQIETFLKEHNGAGVQHIGLHTPDLVHTAGSLRRSGIDFIRPPEAYYTEVGKLDEILEAGQEVGTLKKHGILLDAEADAIKPYNEEMNTSQRYLMQVFTRPLFNEDTFFLEYIQRCGATGFGAGNITALWRAVQQYMDPPPAADLNSTRAVPKCMDPPPPAADKL